jgi:hypothetical protein
MTRIHQGQIERRGAWNKRSDGADQDYGLVPGWRSAAAATTCDQASKRRSVLGDALVRLVWISDAIFELAVSLGQKHRHYV